MKRPLIAKTWEKEKARRPDLLKGELGKNEESFAKGKEIGGD